MSTGSATFLLTVVMMGMEVARIRDLSLSFLKSHQINISFRIFRQFGQIGFIPELGEN